MPSGHFFPTNLAWNCIQCALGLRCQYGSYDVRIQYRVVSIKLFVGAILQTLIKLVALALTGQKRHAQLTDVPRRLIRL